MFGCLKSKPKDKSKSKQESKSGSSKHGESHTGSNTEDISEPLTKPPPVRKKTTGRERISHSLYDRPQNRRSEPSASPAEQMSPTQDQTAEESSNVGTEVDGVLTTDIIRGLQKFAVGPLPGQSSADKKKAADERIAARNKREEEQKLKDEQAAREKRHREKERKRQESERRKKASK